MLTEEYLQRLVDQCLPAARQGKVASYIPKLAEADGNQLGVYWMEPNGAGVGAGQWQKRVTVQSIVKVAIFLQALADCPLEQMTQKISLNATAETFNSIVDLEEKNQHRPLNPYINSGAIATLSLVQGGPGQRFQRNGAFSIRRNRGGIIQRNRFFRLELFFRHIQFIPCRIIPSHWPHSARCRAVNNSRTANCRRS